MPESSFPRLRTRRPPTKTTILRSMSLSRATLCPLPLLAMRFRRLPVSAVPMFRPKSVVSLLLSSPSSPDVRSPWRRGMASRFACHLTKLTRPPPLSALGTVLSG